MKPVDREENGRPDLVLVNAFFSNSVILKGLIEFLGERFRVHFIDLPGFCADCPPLEEISVASFAAFVRRRVDALGLDSYLIGGLSFGFLVVNSLELDARCRAVVAIAPYIDSRSLTLGALKRRSYRVITEIAASTGLVWRAWETKTARRFAHWYSRYPADRVDLILDHMDARTFFQTGRLILRNHQHCVFHDRPYVLIVNPKDTTISYDYVVGRFRKNTDRLLVVETSIDHYPEELSKSYFSERFAAEDLDRIMAFVRDTEC
jgi:pimeloyl-ACP methyl ester carboxylesterase